MYDYNRTSTRAFDQLRKLGYTAYKNYGKNRYNNPIYNDDDFDPKKYFVYFADDGRYIKTYGRVCVSWGGNGVDIAKVLKDNGVLFYWDGTDETKFFLFYTELNYNRQLDQENKLHNDRYMAYEIEKKVINLIYENYYDYLKSDDFSFKYKDFLHNFHQSDYDVLTELSFIWGERIDGSNNGYIGSIKDYLLKFEISYKLNKMKNGEKVHSIGSYDFEN